MFGDQLTVLPRHKSFLMVLQSDKDNQQDMIILHRRSPLQREGNGGDGRGEGKERRGGERGKEEAGGRRGGRKGRDEEKGKGRGVEGSWSPHGHTHMTCLRHAPASTAAAEKRPLSYQTPQFVHMV